jgi:RND family efflux transporter MFP subunit
MDASALGRHLRRTTMSDSSSSRGRRLGFGAAAALLTAILATGCNHAARPQGSKVVEVVVTQPITDDVTDYQDFTGRLDALKTVDIRPRVSGYVMEAPFKEGDVVKAGEVLFKIDPRTYEADLKLAEANLKQAEAERTFQIKKAERDRQLVASGSIQREEYEQSVANRDKAIATVGSMQAARDRARLYLEFTTVTAPLTGRISRRLVDPGNLVNADSTILTTIVTENPMYAYFDVDERTYLELASATAPTSSASASGPWFSALKFPVLMRLANEEEFRQMGYVNFLDNRLNANTGTVRMRGVFSNGKGNLKSGLFVRVRLPLGAPYKTLLIPDEAVQSDQGRKFVYVVNNEDTVEYRPVTLGQSIQALRVIKDGLKEGERVIVTGMQRVRPKLQVQVKMQEPPQPPKSSLTRMLAAYRPEADPTKTDVRAPSLSEMAPARPTGGQHPSKGRR